MMYQVGHERHLSFEALVARSQRSVPGPFVAGPVEASADALTGCLAGCQVLTVGGVLAARDLLLHALETQRRLRRAAPYISAELAPPTIIGGFPRTGTTLLQQLLAASAAFRHVSLWQARHPTAQIEQRHGLSEYAVPRAQAAAERRVAGMQLFEAVYAHHPIDAYGPGEVTDLLSAVLASIEIPMMFDVPEFRERMLARSYHDELGMVAQLLAALDDSAGVPLLLKSPFFLIDYEAMIARLRPRTVVHVRRRAAHAFASFLELAVAARRHRNEDVDPRVVAREMVDLWCVLLRRAADALALPWVDVVTVEYEELIAAPQRALEALGERMPWVAGAHLHAARTEAIRRDQRDRHRPTTATLEDFGLPAAIVERRLEDAAGGYFFAPR